jgi:hypothetical protein
VRHIKLEREMFSLQPSQISTYRTGYTSLTGGCAHDWNRKQPSFVALDLRPEGNLKGIDMR